MYHILRDILNQQVSRWEELAEMTGIDLNDLRRFAIGTLTLSGEDYERLAPELGLELRPHTVGMQLPFENEVSKGIQRMYSDDFEFAAKILGMAFKLIGSRKDGTGGFRTEKKVRGMNKHVVHFCVGIFTKIIKQYRSVIALCEIGQAEDAGIIQRSLFETYLALQFIVRANIPLRENGVKLTDIKYKVKPSLDCPKCSAVVLPATTQPKLRKTSTMLRARMYLAHIFTEHERQLDENIKAGTSTLSKQDEKTIRKIAAKGRRLIGKAWAARQKSKSHFSGLSTRDLARTYKLDAYMINFYRPESHSVHGMDAHRFINDGKGKVDVTLNLGPNPDGIKEKLRISTVFVIGAIGLLNHRFGLGFDDEIRALGKEHVALNDTPDPLQSEHA